MRPSDPVVRIVTATTPFLASCTGSSGKMYALRVQESPKGTRVDAYCQCSGFAYRARVGKPFLCRHLKAFYEQHKKNPLLRGMFLRAFPELKKTGKMPTGVRRG